MSRQDRSDQDYIDAVMTGQVPVYPDCREHREVNHNDGAPPWCNRCGWHRGADGTPAKRYNSPNGGWGTPSGISR